MTIYTNEKTGYARFTENGRLPSEKAYVAGYLGVVPYGRALELQHKLRQAREEGEIPDVLLLLQHPPVFTIGRFRGEEDLIATPEKLQQAGIAVFHTNRGGSITYHGPGQLVGYPIINLKDNGPGVREYIWMLEEVIISLLLSLGIQGERVGQYRGVWVGERKICSIGVHVSRYVTMHGFALNVNTNLQHFDYINPCGIRGNVMTSLAKLLGHPIEVEDVTGALVDSFSAVFGGKLEGGLDQCLAMLDDRSG